MSKSKKSAFLISFLLAFIVGASLLFLFSKPKVQEISKIQFQGFDASTKNFSDLEGELFLVNFWATWCEPCKEELPQFIELEKMFLQKGFRILLVNVDDDANAAPQFLSELNSNNQADLESYYDKDKQLVNQFQVEAVPSSFLINKEGKIIFSTDGFIDWLAEDMIQKVEDELAAK